MVEGYHIFLVQIDFAKWNNKGLNLYATMHVKLFSDSFVGTNFVLCEPISEREKKILKILV